MKFSIIVPVYNVEKYLDKCLSSIVNQTYKEYEVIIVNDGSTDDSQKIIDKYVKNNHNFYSFITENRGLSCARNYGLDYVKGDYILFLDSDDYLNNKLLEELNNKLSKNSVDILRFNCSFVFDDYSLIREEYGTHYENVIMNDAIKELVTRELVEPACLYCYKSSFWMKHDFKYFPNMIHEDYGLTLLILYYVKSITSINFNGYFYLQRQNSISKTINYDKIKKGVYDTYSQYINIVDELKDKESNIVKKAILTYASECLIMSSRGLKDIDYKEFIKKLKEEKIYLNISPYNIKKLIKRIIAQISINLYVKFFS